LQSSFEFAYLFPQSLKVHRKIKNVSADFACRSNATLSAIAGSSSRSGP
jgi:hypothetical protein